jgi:hypothetical protein
MNVTGATTARAAGEASTRCALGAATVTATPATSAAAATRDAVLPSRVLPHASSEARLNGSVRSSALRARTGGIAVSFGR